MATIIGIHYTLYNIPRYIFYIKKYKFELHYYNYLKKKFKTDSYITIYIITKYFI